MDWSEKILCLNCNEHGNLLICSGCPLAIHEECMGCPTSFDGAGNFYCPHCSFKQAVAELCQARKNIKLNRKALLIFMGIESKEHDGQNNEAEAERLRQSEIGAANVITSTVHDRKSRQQKNSLVNPFVQFYEEIGVGLKYTASMSTGHDSKRAHKSAAILNQSLLLNKEDELRDAEGEKIREEDQDPEHPEGETRKEKYETYKTSIDKNTSVKMHVEQKLSSRDEDRIQEEDCGKSWAPTDGDPWPTMHVRAKRRIEMNKLPDWNSLPQTRTASARSKHVKQSDNIERTSPAVNSTNRFSKRSPSSRITNDLSNEEYDASSKWKHPKHPSVKLTTGTLGNERQKE